MKLFEFLLSTEDVFPVLLGGIIPPPSSNTNTEIHFHFRSFAIITGNTWQYWQYKLKNGGSK